MSRIAVLPPEIANQIAAGEVVERPFSVVKELVENAMDAGATKLEIEIEDGGKALIRVSDDGCGMTREEALLSLERHATSKIRSASDLVGVRSFGFRGEALPAICSVSDLELESAVADGSGVSLRSHAGAGLEVREIARRKGTTVTVESLFHNVPARLRFLRGHRSEWRAIQETLIALALVRLDLRLQVSHDRRTALSLSPQASLRDRVSELWGPSAAVRLLDVDDVSGPIHISGLVERPADVGTSTRRVHLVVNGRAVRDSGIVRAAEAAYKTTIPAGSRPSLLLQLVLPADAVDVNVHPAKAELRFRDRWPVERAVEAAVRRTLGTFESGATFGARSSISRPGSGAAIWPARHFFDAPIGASLAVTGSTAIPEPAGVGFHAAGGSTAPDGERDTLPASDARAIEIPPLTQLRKTYMMFERADGIVLIDQHAAHERVLCERFLNMLEKGEGSAQRLLFPLTLHLSPAEADAFEENRASLERLGFEIEGFGGATLLIRAVPMPHPRFDAEGCLRDTLSALTGDRAASSGARHERLAATVACKAAIKAGDALSPQEMRALFVDLARTELPAHDVHGRAVLVHLSWDEVERRFGRR